MICTSKFHSINCKHSPINSIKVRRSLQKYYKNSFPFPESSNGWVARGIFSLFIAKLVIELWLQICVWLCRSFLTTSLIFLCNFPWMWIFEWDNWHSTCFSMHWKKLSSFWHFSWFHGISSLTNYASICFIVIFSIFFLLLNPIWNLPDLINRKSTN